MSAFRFLFLFAVASLLIAGCAYDPQISARFTTDETGQPVIGPQLPLKGRSTAYDQDVARKRAADPLTEPSQIKNKTTTVTTTTTSTPATPASAKKSTSSSKTPELEAPALAINDDDLKLPKPDQSATASGGITTPAPGQVEVKVQESIVVDTTAPKVETPSPAAAPAETPAAPSAPAAAPTPAVVETPTPASAPSPAPAPTAPKPVGEQVAVVETKLGRITIELDPLAAPLTVANFEKLVGEGYYNGTTFHRVIPDFMIQGGDPNSKGEDRAIYGKGGPDYTLQAEIKLKHKRGSVAMARLPNNVNPLKSSNGSQFYICIIDCPFLDGEYTVFGKVISGMEVVDRISMLQRDGRDNPLQRLEMKVTLQPRPGQIPPPPAEATPVAKPAPGSLESEPTKP